LSIEANPVLFQSTFNNLPITSPDLYLTDVAEELETDKLKKEKREESEKGKLINEYISRDYEYMTEHKKIIKKKKTERARTDV
jgi:hypothetical protein